MPPMIIYVLRHGQTNYNLLGLCNDDPGQDVHLTDQGLAQARAAAVGLQDTPIVRIFTSRLPRTLDTARVINRYHGVKIEPRPELDDIRSGYSGSCWTDGTSSVSVASAGAQPRRPPWDRCRGAC